MKSVLVLAACILAASATDFTKVQVQRYESGTNFEKVQITNEFENRIVNGIQASNRDFPYQAAIFITSNGQSGSKCGGALITDRVILTAAHCFANAKKGYVSFGSNVFLEGKLVKFSNVIMHPEYTSSPYYTANDIALLFLDAPAPIDGITVKTIKLEGTELRERTLITVSGFGRTSDSQDTKNLYYTPLTSITNFECRRTFNVADSVFCAKAVNLASTCSGDSGGPVVINWPNNPTHVGIVSFGAETCEQGFPVAFTRTASFIDWIVQNANL